MIPDAKLDELERLAHAATPGPWEWWTSNSWRRLTAEGGREGGVLCPFVNRYDHHPDLSISAEDMAHIASADPPTVLELVRELRETRRLAAVGAEAERHKELGRTWRSALTCGCIFEDAADPDRCTRPCRHHAEMERELREAWERIAELELLMQQPIGASWHT
jgi:hypothetical protein